MIKFGTSGWRAIIGEEFTFNNVRRVVTAIAHHVQKHAQGSPKVVVGYDTRFLSTRFAREAANVLASQGIRVILADRDVPTPVIAFTIRNLKLDGGINFTASHNPPEYNGLKFSTAEGAPAPPEVTAEIEAEIQSLPEKDPEPAALLHDGVQELDCRPAYVRRIKELVDFKVLSERPPKIGVDFLYGTSRGYTETLLQAARIKPECLHNYLDPYFGGSTPDCNEANLKDLMALVPARELDLGISTDGDADRFGIVDEKGHYIRPNQVLGLLAWYLTEARKMKVGLAKTVATTNLIEAIAGHYKLPFYETPVGFKYLGELFLENKIHFGGEESAGLSILNHVPEKDGILAGLLVSEMVAAWRTPLSKLIEQMSAKFGAFYSNRVDLHLSAADHARAPERLKADPKTIGGKNVKAVTRVDGLKVVLEDGAWTLFRLSGTEPVVRIYAEAGSPETLEGLLAAAQHYFLGD